MVTIGAQLAHTVMNVKLTERVTTVEFDVLEDYLPGVNIHVGCHFLFPASLVFPTNTLL